MNISTNHLPIHKYKNIRSKNIKNIKWPVILDNTAIPQRKCYTETLEKQTEFNSGSYSDILLNYWQF